MGVCAPQQSHWAVRPGCAYELTVPVIPVWGTCQGHARDPCPSRCTTARLCACPCQRAPWGVRHGRACARVPAAQSCAYMLTLALEVATCAEATVAAAGPSQSPDLPLSGPGGRACGPADTVGAVLVLALGALMGKPRGAGGGGTKKEKVRGGRQQRRRRRRKRPGMRRALGSRGAGHWRLQAWD